jgi:LPS export ABC transporter protein LptC
VRIRKRLSIPLLIAAALMVYALVATPPRLVQEPAPTTSESVMPDAYAEGVSMRSFSEDGILLERTDASTLRRFEAPGRVEFDEPRRWAYAATGDWYAVSREGELYERSDILELRGDVELRYETESVTFATDELSVNLGRQIAESDVGVRAFQPSEGNEIRADRLFTNLDRQVAVLTGNVRSVYVPED